MDTRLIRKMTPEVFQRLRERIKEVGANQSGSKIAEILFPEFPNYKIGTLTDYARCFVKLTDKTAGYYVDGNISFTMLLQLGTSDLDPAEIEFVAEEIVNNNLDYADLVAIKADLRAGASYALAIGRVTGRIPESPRDHEIKRVRKEFDGLLDKAMETLRTSRFKVSEAVGRIAAMIPEGGERKEDGKKDIGILVDETQKMLELSRVEISKLIDLLPRSALEKGHVHSDFFQKAYMLRHILKEQYESVEKNLKRCPEGSVDGKFLEDARRLVFAIKEQYEFMNQRAVQYLDQIELFMSMEQRVLGKKKEANHG